MSEQETIIAELYPFFEQELITDVTGILKCGKEATVYLCKAAPGDKERYYAAKVYKPYHQRSFKNDAIYQAGRIVGDARDTRAFMKKTARGRRVQFSSWIGQEYSTLSTLYKCGLNVPRPVSDTSQAILMEYIGGEEAAAATLQYVRFSSKEQLKNAFNEILDHITAMLECNIIHGDLSAYNILYWDNVPWIIDFPQAVDARVNPYAEQLLIRDVENVCTYFQRKGLSATPASLVDELWTRYKTGELSW